MVKAIHSKSENIVIDTHVGTWYVIGENVYQGKQVFLLEHETYGDESPCLIVDRNKNIILDGVYNGFADLRESEAE